MSSCHRSRFIQCWIKH